MKYITRLCTFMLFFCALVVLMTVRAESNEIETTPIDAAGVWSDIDETLLPRMGKRLVIPDVYRTVQLDADNLRSQLADAPLEFSAEASRQQAIITLPMPDGSTQQYRIVESPIMQPGLQAKFPDFKTYVGQGVEDEMAHIRLGWTAHGFHATIWSVAETVYIDPYAGGNTQHYVVYNRSDYSRRADDFVQHPPIDDVGMREQIAELVEQSHAQSRVPNGTELRTYRLAVGATGEYTTFHSEQNGNASNVTDGMAAIVVAINRVTGIYERDLAIRLILVDNNDMIVFTSGLVDPYVNDDGTSMLITNQLATDALILPINYDVGHVFSTGGGGVAFLGVPCTDGRKAGGVTGLPAPINDPFYVDYVAHELGHQFGSNHTFNGTTGSCSGGNRSGGTAYEPGSGTTIMAYAGICGEQNTQQNSDDHFHVSSYDEIIAYTTSGNGNSCPVITASNNTPPVPNAGDDFTVPINTPFTLTGSATDAEDHPLTYNWEEYDLGPGGHPNSPTGNAAIFRSFPSKDIPSRTFPQISDIISNTQTIGEILPSYSRVMNFRMTVRDNQFAPSAGGVDYDSMQLTVVDTAGPFLVTSPNVTTTWTAGSSETVTWDVANTDSAPVTCANVDILLSLDGGYTYPVTVLSNSPNDGEQTISVPNNPTTLARIKVACSDNVFFDISDFNFKIVGASIPDFTLSADPIIQAICLPQDATYNLALGQILDFSDAVALNVANVPDGATAQFGSSSLTPPDSTTLTLSNISAGDYALDVVGTAGSLVHTTTLQLQATAATVETLLQAPVNGANGFGPRPTFTWMPAQAGAIASYTFELATDPAFTNVIISESGLQKTSFTPAADLDLGLAYYWRVSAENGCGTQTSETFSFATALLSCTTYDAPLDGLLDNPTIMFPIPSITTLNVPDAATILDVNVVNLAGTHSYINDISMNLASPSGTTITLMEQSCDSEANFNLNLDDDGNGMWPCPPTDGGSYNPTEALSAFNDEDQQGDWTLTIMDNFPLDDGELGSWGLEFCASGDADYSDLPSSYGAAFHTGDGTLRFGTQWDADDSFTAGADDATDDGITFADTLRAGETFTVTIEAPALSGNDGYSGWFDWNADGDFADVGELVFDKQQGSTITATVPATATLGTTVNYRFRLAPDLLSARAEIAATGNFVGGEVTDGQAAAEMTTPTAVILQSSQINAGSLSILVVLSSFVLLSCGLIVLRRR